MIWQTGVIVPIHKKGDRSECTNYRGISLPSFPGKEYAKSLEKRCHEKFEPKLENTQCVFRPGRNNTEKNFHSPANFEKSWEHAKDVYACFSDLDKSYDRFPREKLWEVLWEYSAGGRLLLAVKSLYSCSVVCVHVGGVKSQLVYR